MKKKEDIIKLPDPRLRQKSKRIGYIDEEIRQLAQGMMDATLDWEASRSHETGAALAAVQLGELWRLVVVRNSLENRSDKSFSVFINPEIVKMEGEPTEELEGCLSVESLYGSVPRFPKVKVKALDLTGKEIRLTVTDFMARVFQHEIDHTNGLVFLDRIQDTEKIFRIQPDGTFVKNDPSEA